MELSSALGALVYCLKTWPGLGLAFLCTLSAILYLRTKSQVIVNWPLLGTLPSLVCNARRQIEWHLEVFNSLGTSTFVVQGSISKLKYVITCHPGNVEYILKTNFSNFPKGTMFQEIFDVLGDGILSADSDSWRIQRKMGHSRFTSREFRSLLSYAAKTVIAGHLLPLLANAARDGSVIDLQELCLSFSFQTNEIAITGPENLEAAQIAEVIDQAQDAVLQRLGMPSSLWKFLRWLNVGKERKLAWAKKNIESITAELIVARRESLLKGAQTSDILSMFMTPKQGEKDLSESTVFLRDTLVNLFVAGRETTASGLTWFFWLVSRNPRVEAKILEELKLVFMKKKKEDEGGQGTKRFWVFDSDDLKGLVYLHAALHESLRLYPPVPINVKGVDSEDVLPDGTTVRPGMQILFSIYSMGRMESMWGEDFSEFKPERWINETGELRHELMYKYFVFNAGPRTCMGKDMALTLMKSAAAATLFNFHVEVVKGHSVSLKPLMVPRMKDGLPVKIRERVPWC